MSKDLRKAFLDICNGYSKMLLDKSVVYIKHLSHKEHIDLDEVEEESLSRAKAAGLPDEKTQLDFLKKEGLWTDKNENEIVQQELFLKQMNDGKKHLILPSILEVHLRQIKEGEEKLQLILLKRKKLIGDTCESLATKIVNEYYIYRSLFKDKDLKNNLFSEEEFNDLSDEELEKITIIYNKSIEYCSEDNIKKIALQDFFLNYFYLIDEDIYSFFGKPVIDLTYYQLKLINYAKYFKGIFSQFPIESIPNDIKKDPDKLVSYVETLKNGKNLLDKQQGKAVGLVGATKKDLEMLNVKQEDMNSSKEIKDILKYFPG